MDLNTAALNDWKRPEFESAICYCASLADGRCDFCTGTRALTVFPTTMNPLCRVVAAPTDPKWKADYDAFQLRRNHPVFRNMPYVADNDLCSIQCAHHSQGFTLAEVVHTIYGFGFRTVHAGGIPFGPKFTTYTAAEKWIVETWYAASPNNREVIDRFNLAARAKAEQKPEGR